MSSPSHPIRFMRRVLPDMVNPPDSESVLQPVGKMLMAARFLTAIGTPEAARALDTQMTVTLLCHEDSEVRVHFASAAEAVFAALSDGLARNLMADLCVVTFEGSGSRDQRHLSKQFHAALDTALLRGKAVVAVVRDEGDLSDAGRLLLSRTYRLPPLSGTMVAEVMRALGHAPSRKLAARLSEADDAIACLPGAAIIGALRLETAGSMVRTILNAARRLKGPEKPDLTLEDLHLSDELEGHLRGIVADLNGWRAGAVAWDDVSCSTLLYGPPGCGKTSVAQALAGSAGLRFVSATYAEAQAAGSLSDYFAAMERRAREAIAHAPSLFFVDEIDSLPDRSAQGGHNESYVTAVVNHALELFTRLHRTPGVVVMAASNHISKIDPALIRAGRLDTHFYVGLPDRAGIETILRKRLASAGADLDLAAMSRLLVGQSGADVATAATKARAIARRAGRPITDADLLQVIGENGRTAPEGPLERIALHEAGHAVVCASVGLPLPERAIVSAREAHVASKPPLTLGQRELEQLMATLLGGRAAELLIFGTASAGAESDIAQATGLALTAETRICVGALMPVYLPYSADRPQTWPPELHTAVRKRMSVAQKLAFQAVRRNEMVLRALADALLAARELNAADLERLLRSVVHVPLASDRAPALPVELFAGDASSDPAEQTSDARTPPERAP
ncbi:peptidase M41-like protein [Donghicola tyrosinivorans]|uniref:Peptidase M41-like protein n=2 Tax=Donghicola tyrosinivorans TaxID=1652492 RepID=A0A2T0W894_9RHOB|nr:peptidase M41-like protein [Donghicola tyrosinivorans]